MEEAGTEKTSVTSRVLSTCPPSFMAKRTLALSPTVSSSSFTDFPLFRMDVEGSRERVHATPLAPVNWTLGDEAVRSSAVIVPSMEMPPSAAGALGGLAAVVAVVVRCGCTGGGACGLRTTGGLFACGRLAGFFGGGVVFADWFAGYGLDVDVPTPG